MTRNNRLDDLRADIDDRIESAFEASDSGYLEDVLPAPSTREDRWYGRVLAATYGTVADESDSGTIVPAATSIELLREYYHIRSELLVQVNGTVPHSLNRDPTAALLAGDYLYSMAFAELEHTRGDRSDACYRTLTEASHSMIEAFGAVIARDTATPARRQAYIDDTAGALGASAAAIGATLADGGETLRTQFETVARALAISRRIDRLFERPGRDEPIVTPVPVEPPLREYANERSTVAEEILEALLTPDEIRSFHRMLEESVPSSGTFGTDR